MNTMKNPEYPWNVADLIYDKYHIVDCFAEMRFSVAKSICVPY
jgi:hypothetical protein